MQDAVDSIANAETALLRLDMDVAGALVGRLDEDLVHQLDDRSLLGHLGHFAVVDFGVLQELDAIAGPLLHHGGHGLAAHAEMGLDEPGDFTRTGEHGLNHQARNYLQLIQGVDVERIPCGHHQRAVLPRQRHQRAAMDQLERHRGQCLRLDRYVRQVHQLQAELFGECSQDIQLFGETALDQQFMQRLGRYCGLSFGHSTQVGEGKDAFLHQSLRKLHAILSR